MELLDEALARENVAFDKNGGGFVKMTSKVLLHTNNCVEIITLI